MQSYSNINNKPQFQCWTTHSASDWNLILKIHMLLLSTMLHDNSSSRVSNKIVRETKYNCLGGSGVAAIFILFWSPLKEEHNVKI